ncbi:MAG: hypothetical protein QM817_40595 [Archangium sp.]
MPLNYETELLKAGLSLLTALIALGASWGIGNRIAMHWTLRQKRREMTLAVSAEFYRLYGEFFAVWKLWNYLKRDGVIRPQAVTDAQYKLLERACSAEAGIESILVRLCAERELDSADIQSLASFRQAYHRLRETIREGKSIPWSTSDHVEYAAFKTLAGHVAAIVGREGTLAPPESVATNLIRITSNEWETKWLEAAQAPGVLEPTKAVKA